MTAYRATYSRQGGDAVGAIAQDVARSLHQEGRHQQRQRCDACGPTCSPLASELFTFHSS